MKPRLASSSFARFSHPGSHSGNAANATFHLRQAAQHCNTIMGHLAGAERQHPGSTGDAIVRLQALITELTHTGVTGGVTLGPPPPKDEEE